jgi:hypothetical protein
MGEFYVKGTVRESDCDRNSDIAALVLVQKYQGYNIHNVKDLKPLADAHELWVQIGVGSACRSVRVEIYYSDRLRRWIARTEADSTLCDNLKALPIYRPKARNANETTFEVCSVG